MTRIVFLALFLFGCASNTPQARATGYRAQLDASRLTCVAVAVDSAAPTDQKTIGRCKALMGAP